MKTHTLLTLAALIVGSYGYLIKVPTAPVNPRTTTTGWVHLQKLILPLFYNVCEDSTDPIIVRLAQEFTTDSSNGIYLKPEVITNLKNLITKGLLPKGKIFTNYDRTHTEEFKTIYEVLFFAKDFDTFYKAAAWARQNVNCGLFVNVIYLAILNRRDTERISVPAPYELMPNYFIKKDIIIKASQLLSGEEIVLSESVRDEGNSYVLDANYTADYKENSNENVLAYFHEDIGLNTYYFLQKLRKSPWFNTNTETSIRYGEYLYHMMKQLAARYDLERYANGFSDIKSLNLDTSRVLPYDPKLIYSNGNQFGYRTGSIELISTDNVEFLQSIENSIANIVTHMRDTGYNKTEILNNLMEILVTSDRSYENLLRSSIGKDEIFTDIQPSVLDHYMTSLRDPVFWKINKKIIELVDDALKVLPVYSRNDLYFPGIEILNIDIKKMMTTCENFQFDVTDALKTTTTDSAFQVKINQPRLNHKPFVVKLNISSLVTQKGLIKMYLGPKVAPGEITLKKNLFVLLDSFEYQFKIGKNIVSRSSDEMNNLSEDFTSLRTFRKNVEDAEFGLDALPLKNIETILGFPSRLILPRGTAEGLPLQIFVFIAPFVKPTFGGIFSVQNEEFNSEILSPGYPLDLDIPDQQMFNLPNAIVKDLLVTGKESKSSYGGYEGSKKFQYSSATKPDYSDKRKESFDYTAKKSQYGKKTDYAAKRVDYTKKDEDHTTDKNKIKTDDSDINEINKSKENYHAISVDLNKNNINVDKDASELIYDRSDEIPKTNEKSSTYVDKDDKSTKVDLEKDNTIIFNVDPSVEPLSEVLSGNKDLLPFLTEVYTSSPSVYDYIFNKDIDDFNDEIDVDERIYE